MSTFALRLERLLKENSIKKKDVAEKLGVSPDLVSKWCSNNPEIRRDPNTIHLSQLADMLNVSTDYLLGRTNVENHLTEEDVINSFDEKAVSRIIETHGLLINDEQYTLEELEAVVNALKKLKELTEII